MLKSTRERIRLAGLLALVFGRAPHFTAPTPLRGRGPRPRRPRLAGTIPGRPVVAPCGRRRPAVTKATLAALGDTYAAADRERRLRKPLRKARRREAARRGGNS